MYRYTAALGKTLQAARQPNAIFVGTRLSVGGIWRRWQSHRTWPQPSAFSSEGKPYQHAGWVQRRRWRRWRSLWAKPQTIHVLTPRHSKHTTDICRVEQAGRGNGAGADGGASGAAGRPGRLPPAGGAIDISHSCAPLAESCMSCEEQRKGTGTWRIPTCSRCAPVTCMVGNKLHCAASCPQ